MLIHCIDKICKIRNPIVEVSIFNKEIIFSQEDEKISYEFINVLIFEQDLQEKESILKIVSEVDSHFECEISDEFILFHIPFSPHGAFIL